MATKRGRKIATARLPWWQQPVIIMGHQYPVDIPARQDARTLEELIRWKRSLGFDTEHLLANYSMVAGGEGGEDSRAYLFRNRHGFAGDLLSTYLPLARKHGLRVIIYFNCHWFRSTAFPPDYFLLDATGKPAQLYGSGGGVCPRGPFRAWSAGMAEDLGRYPIDGVFLDGPLQQHCFCAVCRSEFEERFGRPLPASPGDCPVELADAYASFPVEGAVGYVQAFAEGLARTSPQAILYINDIGEGADGQAMRATARFTHFVGAEGGFIGYRPLDDKFGFSAGLTAKVLEARAVATTSPAGRGHRGRVIFSDCGYKCFDYYVHPRGEIARMYAGTIANGANPWFLVLRAGEKTEGIATAARFNRLIARRRSSLANGQSLAEAAILHSGLNFRLGRAEARQRDDVGRRGPSAAGMTVSRHNGEFHGFYAALARSGYPFDIVEEANLLNDSIEPRIRLLILPAVGAMSDAVAGKIRAFVARGGRLLVTFDTSLFDEHGRRRADFALADVFGAAAEADVIGPSKLDYLAVTGRGRLTAGLAQPVLPCPEFWYHVRASSDSEALLHYHRKMPRRYAMLTPASDRPAAVLHRFGRGRSLFIPAAIGDHYRHWVFPDHRRVLLNAATMLADPPVAVEGGGEFVETSLRRGADGSVVLHLTNWYGGLRPSSGAIPLGPLDIRVRLPRGFGPESVRACFQPRRLRSAVSRGTVRFRLPRLADYEMILIR